ncbi:hypothetical protein E5A73_20925 [Sphingomonas gei]|uniref:Uncharacterized protein n=1 Tax=Sphingomonas gei TaxID=1395960 RepID=A0A4S1WYL9_9SPHN|nr:hypothetical protein [Sphingomonas gei]TGX48674.1 hypothetical protein E5A73_20925 [Sphingomonas gei]
MIARQFSDADVDVQVEFTNARIGFFAQMNFCLNVAYYAEMTGRRVFITLSSANYRDPEHGPNWLHYFFEELHSSRPRKNRDKRIRIRDCCQLPFNTDAFSLQSAHDLFFRHFAIRPDITAALKYEAERMGVDDSTLGVHYRGTDKYLEAERVARSTAIAKIRSLLQGDPSVGKVFVASEDAIFVRMMHAEIATVPVVSLSDAVRSEDDSPVHLSGLRPGNRAMGRDALLNCLMLARCGRLVRTTSFLSAWSVIFNPAIRVSMLNQPRPECLWFPETRILEEAALL